MKISGSKIVRDALEGLRLLEPVDERLHCRLENARRADAEQFVCERSSEAN